MKTNTRYDWTKVNLILIAGLLILLAILFFGCAEATGPAPVEEPPTLTGHWHCYEYNIDVYLLQINYTKYEGALYLSGKYITELDGKIVDDNYLFSTQQSSAYEIFNLGFLGKIEGGKLTGQLNGSVYANNIVYGFGNISVVFEKVIEGGK